MAEAVLMARPRGEITVVCQNLECNFYRKENGKNIIKRGYNCAGHRQYYCFHCRKYFVETAGTPLYRRHLSKKEIIHTCKLLVEKNGVRSIERITGHHRDTISNLLRDMAGHAVAMNGFLMHDVGLDEMEVDELWCTVKKNKRKLSAAAHKQLKKATHGSTPA